MVKFHDIPQNEDLWFSERAGRVTGSALSKVMANFGKAFGEPAKAYAVNIALERITGEAIKSNYSNSHMDRGHEEEPIARRLYEDAKFTDVTNGGIWVLGKLAVSPDGMVGDDGVIEIKSVIASQQYKTLKGGKIPSSYRWQTVFELMVTGREWLDYVSYSSEFPEGRQLWIYRLFAKDLDKEFNMVQNRLNQFEELVEETMKKINENV